VSGRDVLAIGDGKAIFAGAGSPVTHAINIDTDLERVEKFFFDRGADSIIQVTPWSSPAFLGELATRGYRIHEFESVFAMDISKIAPDASNIDIRVTDDIETWARVGAEAFATEEMSADFLVDVLTPFGRAKQTRCYLAYLNGEAAASGAMVLSGELKVAGLFGAGTLPKFRRRGLQTIMLHRRLSDASKEGCDIAMVTTLPGSDSHRNVARRGFELLYTKLSMRRAFA
jgi:hypothetical protein